MGLIIVLAIAITVGVLVFLLTDGGEIGTGGDAAFSGVAGSSSEGEPPAGGADDVQQWAGGEVGGPASSAGGPSPGRTVVQVSPETSIPVVATSRSWQARLSGALGLVVAIGIGAIAIALTLYGIGMLIARLVSAGTGSGSDVAF
jgi:hypothetical protein